jgi:hypothetical protein
LHDLRLRSFAKTSGSKGLQLFVPLNTATTYEKTKLFAHALAEQLEQEHPDQVVSRMQKLLLGELIHRTLVGRGSLGCWRRLAPTSVCVNGWLLCGFNNL